MTLQGWSGRLRYPAAVCKAPVGGVSSRFRLARQSVEFWVPSQMQVLPIQPILVEPIVMARLLWLLRARRIALHGSMAGEIGWWSSSGDPLA